MKSFRKFKIIKKPDRHKMLSDFLLFSLILIEIIVFLFKLSNAIPRVTINS